MNKLRFIDSLRGIAIIGVILVHCIDEYTSQLPKNIVKLIENGANGVQLFFIASAFTLFLSMDSRHLKEKHPFTFFFIRRFFRIAPMYYLGIIYYLWQDGLGARYWLADQSQISVGNIISNFTFTHGVYPYWINSLVPGGWSITVEMTFYLVLPILFLKIKSFKMAVNFLSLTLILKLILDVILKHNILIQDNQLWESYLFLYFPSQLPVFAIGIVFYFMVKQNFVSLSISNFSILIILSLLLLKGCGLDVIPSFILFFGVAFLLLGIYLSLTDNLLFVNRVTMYIGEISYSIYLVHFAIIYWLNKLGFFKFLFDSTNENATAYFLLKFLCITIIAIIVSTITYRIIELPMQKIGKKIIGSLT